MSNFSYLSTRPEYSLFANSAIEAEKVFSTSPAMCAVGCRKALELAVKWVYAADKTITMPYKDNLQSLLHEPSFRFAVDRNVWSVLPSIVKAGNLAVHTGHSVSAADAVFSLRGLFDFIQWVDYCYGTDYVERSFEETAIPGEKVALDEKKIREQESLLTQKDAELEALRKQVESLSAAYTASKQQNQQSRSFTAADLTEAETRRKIIDIDLKAMGWKFTGPDADVRTEYEVDNMNGVLGQKGYADYVLMGKDGLPLAVIEAKRSTKDPNIGRKQAQLYANCLEQKFGRRPMLFTTNGYTIMSRLIEGEFLNYESVIPKESRTKVVIDCKSFIDTLERASLIITDRLKNPLRINFAPDKVTVRCQTPLGKVVDEFTPESMEGDSMEIGFNNRYLLDALRYSQCAKLRLEINGPLSPVKVLPVEGEDFIYLVLPVRFKNEG